MSTLPTSASTPSSSASAPAPSSAGLCKPTSGSVDAPSPPVSPPASLSSTPSKDFTHIDGASRIQSVVKTKRLEQTLQEQRSGDKNDPQSRWHRARVMAEHLGQLDDAPAPAVKGVNKAAASPSQPTCPDATSDGPQQDRPSRVDSLTEQLRQSSFFDKLPFSFKSEAEKRDFIKESKIMTKRMEDQNWLEMLDPQHRYGSNLKHYHRYWNTKAETTQNFLYWLDEGDGKELSLEDCPREKLEAEKIAYLTADQRKNYMTYIDNDFDPKTDINHTNNKLRPVLSASFSLHAEDKCGKGRLRWCRTGELVNTSKYDHGDLGKGRGVALRESQEWQMAVAAGDIADVVRDDKIKIKRRGSSDSSGSFTSYEEHSVISSDDERASSSTSDRPQDDKSPRTPKSSNPPKSKADFEEKHQTRKEKLLEKANLGPKYLIKNKLGLYSTSKRQQIISGTSPPQDGDGERTVESEVDDDENNDASDPRPDALIRRRKADTWIFVTDLSYNMYIGIKQRGRFQHSSLLAGSLVTVAGVLKVKDGLIVSIYPWSGHYRSSAQHFEEFVKRLHERGLDTSKINVTKSKMIIEVVNRYGMYRKKKDRKIRDWKDKLHEAWQEHVHPSESTPSSHPEHDAEKP